MNQIVTVNVSQTIAPTPSDLQKTGALISQGATITSPGTRTLLKQAADLDTVVVVPAAITSAAWTTVQVVGITTTQAHGLPLGDTVQLTIAGVTSSTAGAFNGTYPCTITGASTFTYPTTVASSPGAGTGGTWVDADVTELQAMVDTFFAQGSQQGVYVLELGSGTPAEGVEFLETWIGQNPGVFYSYLVPRAWDSDPVFLALLADFEATNAKTYFFITTTLSTYANYSAAMKCAFLMIEAPAYGTWSANAITNLAYSAAWAQNTFTAASWAAGGGGIITATTTTAHGVLPGQQFTSAGNTPAGYNGTFIALPGTTGSTLKYASATDPGANTVLGHLSASAAGTVTATTTAAHGVSVGQYFTIAGSVAATIPGGYNGTFKALVGTTGSTLVYGVAADPGSDSVQGTLVASLYSSTGAPSTEFSAAAALRVTLNYRPSTTNRVTPTAFSFLFGVTPFPTEGNAALLATLKAAFINVVGTGAEGGISTSMISWGTTRDGRDFTYWYSVDWVQINSELAIANAVINGSNNPLNPLYYNQDGINRLQQVAAATLSSGLTFGLVLGAVKQTTLDGAAFQDALDAGDFDGLTVINAVPFVPYSQANPSDYALGQYSGLSCVYVPTRGFTHIVFNVNVTDFVTA